jgi:PEP-CTERM motif
MKLVSINNAIATCLLAATSLGSAQAATFTENFDEPFTAWESGWFGTLSDAKNYACFNGLGCDSRANNPDGLWVAGTEGDRGSIVVTFDSALAAAMNAFKLDVAGFSATRLTAVDKDGAVIFDEAVTLTSGAFEDPGRYATYTITSTNGIGGFGFSGPAAGNTSIDNLVATVVPEPASLALMLAGLTVVGAVARRRPQQRG